MSTVQAPASQRLVLYGIDWPTYTRLLRTFARGPAVRITYDRGVLEIMSPLLEHESPADLLGRFVVVLTEELGLPLKAAGSTTLRRKRRKRGLEPDRAWWIASEPVMRGKQQLDLRSDPPPDLAVEIDVASSSLDRLSIYAALGVPEVWRLDAHGLTFRVLQADGSCAEAASSRSFPGLTPADLAGFLALARQREENDVVRQFRAWVVQQRTAGILTPPSP